jgi:hypothetical protein
MKTLKLKHNLVLEGTKISGRILDIKWNDSERGDFVRVYSGDYYICSARCPFLGERDIYVWGKDDFDDKFIMHEYDTAQEAKEMFDFIMKHTYEHIDLSKKKKTTIETVQPEVIKYTDSETTYSDLYINVDGENYKLDEYEEMLKKGRRELARWKKYLSGRGMFLQKNIDPTKFNILKGKKYLSSKK